MPTAPGTACRRYQANRHGDTVQTLLQFFHLFDEATFASALGLANPEELGSRTAHLRGVCVSFADRPLIGLS